MFSCSINEIGQKLSMAWEITVGFCPVTVRVDE